MIGTPGSDRTSVCRCVKPMPYRLATGAEWCERRELNPHGQARRSLSAVRLPVSPRSRFVFQMTLDDWRWREGSSLRVSVYKTAALHLSYANLKFTNGRDKTRPIEIASLPETTVCRPTKGNQYRISGPSYVLAGTAILNSKSLHVIASSRRRQLSAGCARLM